MADELFGIGIGACLGLAVVCFMFAARRLPLDILWRDREWKQ